MTDAPIGILMLDTRFPRPVGDIGNPASFPFPVRYRTVPQATPHRVVRERAEGLLPGFVAAGRALAGRGCGALTTSCGFLALHQDALARALPVPFAASALMLLPLVEAMMPGRRAGVLTASNAALTPPHLTAAGARAETPVEGLDPASSFVRTLLGDLPTLDAAEARAETVSGARRLAARGVGAIVLECTNLPPYSGAVRAATGLPVWSVLDLVTLLRGGVASAATRHDQSEVAPPKTSTFPFRY